MDGICLGFRESHLSRKIVLFCVCTKVDVQLPGFTRFLPLTVSLPISIYGVVNCISNHCRCFRTLKLATPGEIKEAWRERCEAKILHEVNLSQKSLLLLSV